MKPTKEEIKEYFKDALEVECLYSGKKCKLKKGFKIERSFVDGRLYTFDVINGRGVYLSSINHKRDVECFAKITKRQKTNSVKVPKQFVLDSYDAACSEWKEKLRLQFPDLFPVFSVKIGDRFELDGDEYILARVGYDLINLINPSDGYNWNKPFKVKDSNNITHQEFEKLCDGFKLNKIS